MNDIEALAQELALNYKGNVGLRRSLAYRDDVDAVASEGGEEFAGYARVTVHVVPDHCHGREPLAESRLVDCTFADFAGKFPVEHLAGLFGIPASHS